MTPLIARRPQRSYNPAPAGIHLAVAVDVQNIGLVQTAWGQKHKVRLVWQIAAIDETHNRRFELARLYTLSLHERAALRQDLEQWRGKKFTDAEMDAGFDLERLIGVNCQLVATQDLSDDGTMYTNVTSVLPAPPGVAKLFPLDFTRLKDRTGRNPNDSSSREKGDDPIPF